MSYSLVNPTGWTDGDTLTATQLNQLDQDHASSVDGSGGGNYTLGSNMSFAGGVGITWTFSLPVVFSGNVQIGNDALDELSVIADTTFTNFATFQNIVQFNEAVTFDNNVEMNFNLLVKEDTELRGPVTFTDEGKICYRSLEVLASGNRTIYPAQYDTVFVPNTIPNEADTFTISNTGAQEGMMITVVNDDVNDGINVTTPSPLVQTYYILNVTGNYRSRTFKMISGKWREVSSSLVV